MGAKPQPCYNRIRAINYNGLQCAMAEDALEMFLLRILLNEMFKMGTHN